MIGGSIVIIGGGIMGLTVARELVGRGVKDILLLEKGPEPGLHASGRNSGVLHAGIYYGAETLKAKTCLEGNRLMRDFCREKGLPILPSGKVIVAKTERELPTLLTLFDQAKKNGCRVELLDEKSLKNVEPEARTVGSAIYSPDTFVVSPKKILKALVQDLESQVTFLWGTRFIRPLSPGVILTSQGPVSAPFLVNCSGASADSIAHQFQVGKKFRFLPFKGQYKKLRPERHHWVRGNIYPVPDPLLPFLGLHFTRSADGDVYFGPNAFPVFGREHYQGIEGLGWESPAFLYRLGRVTLANKKLPRLAFQEVKRYCPQVLYREAKGMLPALEENDLLSSPKVGIRPQLVDWETKELVMDFIMEKDREGRSLHLLNAISPAFTSSMSLARTIADQIFKI